jgi:hypothetical protein
MSEMQLLHPERLPFSRSRRASRWPLFLALVCAVLIAAATPASAQSKPGASSIEVPPEIKVAPAVVTHLQVKIDLAKDAPPQTILLVRGVPPRVMLSEGRLFGAGVWAVPLTSLGKLEIAPATGTSGTSELSFEVITLDGKVIAGAKSVLSIEPEAAAGSSKDKSIVLTTGTADKASPPAAEHARPAPRPAPVALSPQDAEEARQMTERGDESMEEGKITAARLFYKAAAEMGWAPAAFALAKTYDGNELARSKVVGGVVPDPALAKKWYERARELGSADASRRLPAAETR